MSVSTYDPGKGVLSFAGYPIHGFADGTAIEAERTNDSFSMVSGADGEVARSASRDRTGFVTVHLLQTSASNDDLSRQLDLDEKFGTGVGPLQFKDLSGRTVFKASASWVRKPPALSNGKEVTERVWIIDCGDLDIQVRGNFQVGTPEAP